LFIYISLSTSASHPNETSLSHSQQLRVYILYWWRWALVRTDGVAPSWMVCVSASVNLPLHHKVQKFSSGTGSPGWSRKKGRKTVVCYVYMNFSVTC